MIVVAALIVALVQAAKTVTVPITKTAFAKPVTRTQKMLSEYHHARMEQKFESMIELLPYDSTLGKLRLQQQQASIELANNLNLAYVGPVLFGTPLQPESAQGYVYDTGSGYLTTTSTNCQTCSSNAYNPAASTTAGGSELTTKQLDYGSASLKGYLGSDQVCLASEMCVNNFQFFVITWQSGLSGYDGILGLSPPDEAQNGPSYTKALYSQGIIDKEEVTFWLNFYGNETSTATFGGVPANATVGKTFSQDLYSRYDQWWTVKMHNVEYGGTDIKNSGIAYAILDTGTSLLYLGTQDYNAFVSELTKSVPELDCTSNIYCFSKDFTCDQLTPRMKPLMINLQENYYTLPPEAYTFSRSNLF